LSATEPAAVPPKTSAAKAAHPVRDMVIQRTLLGVLTLFFVSVIVFTATQVLPGNAAYAVLGQTATPQSLASL